MTQDTNDPYEILLANTAKVITVLRASETKAQKTLQQRRRQLKSIQKAQRILEGARNTTDPGKRP